MRDVVRRVVIADVLQGCCDGFDQVVLADGGHGVDKGESGEEFGGVRSAGF